MWNQVYNPFDNALLSTLAAALPVVLFAARAKFAYVRLRLDHFLNPALGDGSQTDRALQSLAEGGLFGYRLVFPAMRVGRHEVYWHRPLAAYLSTETEHGAVLPLAPLGYLTAYDADAPNLAKPIELWPRLLDREGYGDAVSLFDARHDHHPVQTALNVRKLLDANQMLGSTLPTSMARRILSCPKHESLDAWLDGLPDRSRDPDQSRHLVEELRLLRRVRVIICLGGFAWDGVLRVLRTLDWQLPRKPRFGHGAEVVVGPYTLVGLIFGGQLT